MNNVFKSKAKNLQYLQNKLKSAKVLPLITISLQEVKNNKNVVLEKINSLNSKKIIIRSSSSSEDTSHASNAGAFLSIANVNIENENELFESITKVGNSMPLNEDCILVQPMLEDIMICGVAFSVDKENNAPYFSISYDSSGSNDAITSGSKAKITNFYHYRFLPTLNLDSNMIKVINLIEELENIFQSKSLDIEFAITNDLNLYCLQVRPLVMQNKPDFFHSIPNNALSRLQKRINSISQKHPNILGDKTIFGVMPDWNPAEIIGIKPKRLALSLYKEIVTDNVWAYQRDNYGYRNLRSYPLMHSFLGIPYIDVRVSFNSFIPKKLNDAIASKLINFYIKSLINTPELHDKVEFDIVFSCYDLNTPNKLKMLLKEGFNSNEIKRIEFALLELTNNIINPKSGLYLKDLKKATLLREIYDEIVDSNLSIYDKIYWLIENCKRFGTLPFAGVARGAFIAMQLLNSLVEIGFLSKEERQLFLSSLKTVSKELSVDINYLNENTINDFLQKYGHLRAGSYNILSPRYDEAFDIYFGNIYEKKNEIKENNEDNVEFSLSSEKYNLLDRYLIENGLEVNARELFEFFRIVIEGREKIKFEFSRLLSEAIKLIKELGDSLDISPEDMAHLDIKSILSLYSSLYKDSPKDRFLNEIKAHKEEFNLTLALKLPPLIINSNDIYSFYYQKTSPNFITSKSIIAPCIQILDSNNESNIEGKIVLIHSADPGYDYLFTKNIAGLITCYGGANSHMAIRASELNLPSVIGVGEENFNEYIKSKKIKIDCESEQIFCL